MQNFIKIHPVGAEFFNTDGQTDMTKLIVAFHSFANSHNYQTDVCRTPLLIYKILVKRLKVKFLHMVTFKEKHPVCF
jgi:hypothetical protein